MRKTPLPLIYTILLLVAAVAIAALALSLSAAGTQPTVYRVVSIKPTHYHPVSLTTLEVRLRDLHARHLAQAARARHLAHLQWTKAHPPVTTTTTVPYVAPVTTTTEPYYDYATTTTTQPYVAPTYSGDGYVDPSSLPWPYSCIVRVESGGTNAQNPYSSASGYFQFLDSTWTAVSGLPAPASAYSFAEQYAVAQSASLSNWTDGC